MKRFKLLLTEALAEKIPKELHSQLPGGYQPVGDIMILFLNPGLANYEKEIGKAALSMFKQFKTICVRSGKIYGEKRIPEIRKVAGGSTETIHAESGCKFALDVTKVMFSKGNVTERARLPGLVSNGETIVDMFSGIGYFSIPIALHSKAKKIIAIELNNDSVKFLRKNIMLNQAKNIEVIHADNRITGLKGIADRIIMGYLPGTEKYLPAAMEIMKPAGGTIHFHNIYKKDYLWKEPVNCLKTEADKTGFNIKIKNRIIVKKLTSEIRHVVVDAELTEKK